MFLLKSPILLFLILAGLIATSVSAWSIFTVYQSKSWPYIEDGRILEADCRDSGDGDKVRYVKYQYSVATQQYVNDREFFGLYTAEKECSAGYRVGQYIMVFYNPANPSDSVLKSGDYQTAGYGMLFGLALLLSALLTYFFGRKKQALATVSTPTENSAVSLADDDLQNLNSTDESAVENKILHQAPVLRDKNFICHRSAFQVKLAAGILCVTVPGILSTYISDWKDFLFLFFVFFLIPGALIYPVLSKASKPKIYFWADKRGLFFPRGDGVLNAEQQQKQNWLFVPWQNVSNLRNAAIRHDDALVDSIAFDIKISPQERKEFFRKAKDREQSFANGTLSLGYGFGVHPSIAILFDLMEQTTTNDYSTSDYSPKIKTMATIFRRDSFHRRCRSDLSHPYKMSHLKLIAKTTQEAAVKNQIFQHMPTLEEEHLVYDVPLSVAIVGKLGFGLGGIGFIVMALGDTNSHLDLWKKVAICLAGTALILIAAQWYSRIFFLADKRGMFFPCSDGSRNSKGQKKHNWLFVPWKNIVNIRTAQAGDSSGIGFDVRVSPEEKESFFRKAECPVDRKEHYVHGVLRVGYSYSPHPSIESLLKLKKQTT